MYCTNCGSAIQEGAKFCAQCGTKIEAIEINSSIESNVTNKCTIVCTEMEYKWALFGKFNYRFQACLENGEVIMESDKMALSGFEYNGPKEGARRYQKIFDKFVEKLEADGWQKSKDKPDPWYGLTFYK